MYQLCGAIFFARLRGSPGENVSSTPVAIAVAADIPLGIASTPQGFSRRAREGRRFIRSVGTYTLMPSLNFLQK
jgi:hypothetical protein